MLKTPLKSHKTFYYCLFYTRVPWCISWYNCHCFIECHGLGCCVGPQTFWIPCYKDRGTAKLWALTQSVSNKEEMWGERAGTLESLPPSPVWCLESPQVWYRHACQCPFTQKMGNEFQTILETADPFSTMLKYASAEPRQHVQSKYFNP